MSLHCGIISLAVDCIMYHCFSFALEKGISTLQSDAKNNICCWITVHFVDCQNYFVEYSSTWMLALLHQSGAASPGSLILPPWHPWVGAHSYLRGHIWLVLIRTFVANQANVNIPRLFRYIKKMCLFKHIRNWLKCAPLYAVLSQTQHRRDYALLGGHFWPKFDGRGHKNILKDQGDG